MITIKTIIRLHELSIINFGGSQGIRDPGLMESAIARPYQTFGGEYLYPTVFEKAFALVESIITNHPFIDGNKRTGFLSMLLILELENFKITASNDATYNFTIQISTGEIKFEEIVLWLKNNTAMI